MAGGWSWAIPENAPNHDLSWRVIEAMSEQESQTRRAVIEGTLIDINFIVYLEEIQITANESIVSTIKQSAQSLNQ